MIFDLGWKTWAAIAAIITAIASLLWWFGVIPWWGILIAVPAATLAGAAMLIVIGFSIWMARGAH